MAPSLLLSLTQFSPVTRLSFYRVLSNANPQLSWKEKMAAEINSWSLSLLIVLLQNIGP